MHNVVGIAPHDLKPENLLFQGSDAKIIKIADFGESKSFKEAALTTYCGTPDYMAPEIIRGDNYGPEVDIWSIGVISYVMLGGFPPFDGDNDVEVFASILSVKYDFPNPEWTNITPMAKDFIRSIFVPAEQRLSASQCLMHPWIVMHVPVDLRCNVPLEKKESNASMVDSDDEGKKKKKEIGKKGSNAGSTTYVEEELNSKDPKKHLLDTMNDMLKTQSTTTESVIISGELRTMMAVVQATSGNSDSDLEDTIYGLYWERIKEIRSAKKSGSRTPMSARTPGSGHKRKKEKKT